VLATVAVGYTLAALVAGRLGDRFGLARVIFLASFVYGIGLLLAGLAQAWHNWYYGLILPVALAGGTVMTLAWALLFKLMPSQHRGAIAGLATTTKGLGLLVGPLVAGVMIDLMAPYLKKTEGYAVLWPVCAIPVLAAIPLVATLMKREREASGRVEPQPG
jgi:MFS family permease